MAKPIYRPLAPLSLRFEMTYYIWVAMMQEHLDLARNVKVCSHIVAK